MNGANGAFQIGRRDIQNALVAAATRDKADNILLAGPWGSGKTVLLKRLRDEVRVRSGDSSAHVLWFSPWDNIADGDPRTSFLRVLRDELKCIKQTQNVDKNLLKRVDQYLGVLEGLLGAEFVKKTLAVLPFGDVTASVSGGIVKLVRAVLKNTQDEKEHSGGKSVSVIDQMRKEMRTLLKEIAKSHEKSRVLLLVDDLDRARPEDAVATLDSLYHLLMPYEEDEDWPLTSVWAVNTAVLEEFLYREYRELPSFDPNAYLEKQFRRRINVPPLFYEDDDEYGGSQRLWRAEIKGGCPSLSTAIPEIAGKLAEEVNYAILGNLRLHARVRRDCMRLWRDHQDLTAEKLVREARLVVLVAAFPAFRTQIAPFNGMWPQFINRMNRRQIDSPVDMVMNPLYRHVDSPDLPTLLVDLGVLRYDQDRRCFVLIPAGKEQLQKDLNVLAHKGI